MSARCSSNSSQKPLRFVPCQEANAPGGSFSIRIGHPGLVYISPTKNGRSTPRQTVPHHLSGLDDGVEPCRVDQPGLDGCFA